MSDTKRELKTQTKLINQDNRISALKKQLVYYKEITETVREPFIILDSNLKVITANFSFYDTFNVFKKDIEGRSIYKISNNQWDTPELRLLLDSILPSHRVLSNYAVKHSFPKVGNKTILLNARQVDNKQLILLAMEDVTAQWKLKSDREKMTKNLIIQSDQLQKLNDAKDDFISLASHQLRTPATVVKQYLGMLRMGLVGKLTKGQLEMLGVADKNNERQLEIIEDLLRVAKVDAGKVYLTKSAIDISVQIKKAIAGQIVIFKSRGQTIVFQKPENKILVDVDPKLIIMVIENILDNAGKYSAEGKQVVIDIEKNSMYVVIRISDQGVGIKKSDFNNLFKKFSRLDNFYSASVKGTGLGLYWAKKIVDMHGGIIQVESTLNKGSVFRICLPVAI